MKKAEVLALALVVAVALAPHTAQARPAFHLVGRLMRLSNGPNETVTLRLGRVWEATAAGAPVAGHALPSLARLLLDATNGTKTLNGTDVPFVQLSLRNLSAVPGFQAATCPGGGAPLANTVPVASSSINLTVLYNVTADLLVEYGDGLIDLPAGAIKFNIDAAGWPFCAAGNQLMVELAMYTSRQGSSDNDDAPVLLGGETSGTDGTTHSGGASVNGSMGILTPVSVAVPPRPVTRRLHLLRTDDRPTPGQQGLAIGGGGGGSNGTGQQGSVRKDLLLRPASGHPLAALRNKTGRARLPGGRGPRLLAALVSPSQAAALNLETIAYDAPFNATRSYNVSIYMKPQKEAEDDDAEGNAASARVNSTRIILGFPSWNGSLHYDPTLSVESAADVGYTYAGARIIAENTITPAPAAPKNGAGRAGARALLGGAAVVGALLLAL